MRPLIPFLMTLCVAASALCPPASADDTVYRFSPVNQYDINLTAAYWNPIISYVSEKSGVKLSLKIGRTSADTTSYVLAKEVEFVFTNHLFSPEREKLGWRVFGRRNTPPIQGQIVVPAESPIQHIRELKDMSVAFPGPEAFIAYKVPYAHLLNQNISVNVVFGGNMNGALAQLFAGKVQAVGGNSQLIDAYAQREKKSFRVLWTSEPYHDLALMASSKVSDATMKAVATAFFNMKNDPKGREILHEAAAKTGMDKDAYFIPSDGSEYASYRRFYQTAPSTLR